VAQCLVADRLAAHEPVHEGLVTGVAELHDEIVDHLGEPSVAEQREAKGVALLVPVVLAQRHDAVRTERVQDGADRFDGTHETHRRILRGRGDRRSDHRRCGHRRRGQQCHHDERRAAGRVVHG
jgi:hypothetical protein